jgi:hypothetical protein
VQKISAIGLQRGEPSQHQNISCPSKAKSEDDLPITDCFTGKGRHKRFFASTQNVVALLATEANCRWKEHYILKRNKHLGVQP